MQSQWRGARQIFGVPNADYSWCLKALLRQSRQYDVQLDMTFQFQGNRFVGYVCMAVAVPKGTKKVSIRNQK